MSIKIIDYTSPDYAEDKLDLWSPQQFDILYNFSQEIMLRNDRWRDEFDRQDRNREIFQGKLLNDEQIAALKDNKVPVVQPKVVSTMIDNLSDTIYRAHNTGAIRTIYHDDNAVAAADLDLLIKQVKRNIKWEHYIREITKCGIAEGGFPFLKIEINDADVGRGRLSMRLYQPNQVLPEFTGYYTSSLEINDVILIDWVNRDSLYINYPDKHKILDEYYEMYGTEQNFVRDFTKRQTIQSREMFEEQLNILRQAPRGSVLRNRDNEILYTWLRKVVADVNTFIDYDSSTEIILDETWDEQRINDFLFTNPHFQLVKRKRYVVWETVMTTLGLVLRNRMYPVQIPTTNRDVMLPGVIYVPNIKHGKPESFIDTIHTELEDLALAASECRYQLYNSTGKTVYFHEGALSDANSTRTQLQARLGLIPIKQGHTLDQIRVEQQAFNTNALQYYNEIMQRLESISGMSQEMQGRMQAGSSNYRTRAAILASLSSHGSYIRNLTEADVQLTNALLYLFAITTTEGEVFAVTDEQGNEHEVRVNEFEIDRDPESKAVRIIRTINDLRRGKFVYEITEVSTNELAEEYNREGHDEFWSTTGQVLAAQFQQDLPGFANILKSMSNPLIRAEGEALERQAASNNAPTQELNQDAQTGAAPITSPNATPEMGVNQTPQDINSNVPMTQGYDDQQQYNDPMIQSLISQQSLNNMR